MLSEKAEKATILVDVNGANKKISVMFNPTELSESRVAVFTGEGANKKFTKSKLEDLSVSLFFDTYESKQDVRDFTDEIYKLPTPQKSGKDHLTPYLCTFMWGKFIYTGYVKKVDQKFTMFLSSGIPVRAELNVTFESQETESKHKENSGQGQCRKFWTIKSGDRLDLIAGELLGDQSLWRVIARANNISDSIRFPTSEMIGKVIVIPDYYNTKEIL